MKELNPFLIDDDTKPSYETDVAKWFLIKKNKYYAAWLWECKKDKNNRKYLMTDIDTSEVVSDDHLLESVLVKLDLYEKARDK